jgi:dTDP-4-dehydrorhamnose reductase
MRSLIFGAGGLLGRPLVRELERRGAPHLGLDHAAADITDAARVTDAVRSFQPDVVFNCAAFTRVDDCEEQQALAHEVNGRAVGHLAAAARAGSALLVQVSTDYVFDGASRRPYLEESRTAPIQVYGQSKLEGERLALEWERSMVVRTSWLFGPGGASFVATMLRLFTKPAPVRVVDDQIGCPTYAPFLARALVELAEHGARGVVHYRNEGPVSWRAFAVEIARRVAPGREIQAISSAEMPRPARRPAYSVLDVERFETIVGRPVESWRDGLDACLPAIAARSESADPGRRR